MTTNNIDKSNVMSAVKRIKRYRQVWFVCWVPGAYSIALIFHALTGSLPPFFADIALILCWVGAGYIVSAVAYKKVVTPIYGQPMLRDILALELPTD